MPSSNKVELVATFKDDISGPAKTAGGNVQNLGKLAAGAGTFVIGLGVAVLALAKKMGDLAASIRDTGADLGVTTDEVQGINYAFEQTGGAANTFETAMKGVTGFMKGAERGGAAQVAVLEKLGVTYGDLAAMNAAEQFYFLTDAMGAMEESSDKATTGAYLFGGAYQQIIGTLNQTEGSIRGMSQAYQESDMMIPAEDITSLGMFADKWTDVEKKMDSLMVKVVVPFLPAIESVFDGLENLSEFAIPHLIAIINDGMPALIGFVDALAFIAEVMNDIKPDLVSDEMERFDDILKDLGETAKTDVVEGLQTANEAFSDLIERTNTFIEAEGLNEVQAAYLKRGMAALGAELYFTGLQQSKLAEETEASNTMITRMSELIAGMNITGYTEQINNLTLAELKLAESMYQVVVSSGFLSDTFSDAAVLALEEIQVKIEEMAVAVPPPGTLTPEFLEKEIRARDQVKALILVGIEEAAQAEIDVADDRLEQEETSHAARMAAIIREKVARMEAHNESADEREERTRAISRIAEQGATSMGRILINKTDDWETHMMIAIGKMILAMAAIQIGGPVGWLAGFAGGLFQGGGRVQHAKGGATVVGNGAGLFGDLHPFLLERDEVIIPREQALQGNTYGGASTNVYITIPYQPTVPTPGSMVVLANVVTEALDQAGISSG